MNIHSIYAVVSPLFRRRRMAMFLREIAPGPGTKILDVGGYPRNWEGQPCEGAMITVLNVDPSVMSDHYDGKYRLQVGDATQLPYADGEFDVVFSNSVIEHVGDWQRQQAVAHEALRVGRSIWVQTPARCFPIEPHFMAPFIHWLPVRWQRRLARRFTIWGILTKPSTEKIAQAVAGIRLLTYREMTLLFPGCRVITERFLGLPKSYIACRRG